MGEEQCGDRSWRDMAQLFGFVLFAGYVVGVWKFWRGYSHTNFSRSLPTRLILSGLWPALLVINPAYRKNFRKALKGQG